MKTAKREWAVRIVGEFQLEPVAVTFAYPFGQQKCIAHAPEHRLELADGFLVRRIAREVVLAFVSYDERIRQWGIYGISAETAMPGGTSGPARGRVYGPMARHSVRSLRDLGVVL